MKNQPFLCESFKPFVNRRSQILILGSMPGPEALRKQQYYGFTGNHFWTILPALFNEPKPLTYNKKLNLLRRNNVALWDVLESCIRPGALDSSIKDYKPNKIPDLLEKYPNIKAIFVNGQFAHKVFMKSFGEKMHCPVVVLPSTSPANAAMTLQEKTRKWATILKFLYNSPPL